MPDMAGKDSDQTARALSNQFFLWLTKYLSVWSGIIDYVSQKNVTSKTFSAGARNLVLIFNRIVFLEKWILLQGSQLSDIFYLPYH